MKYLVFWNIFLALPWIGIVYIDARILPNLSDYDGPVLFAVILTLWAAFLALLILIALDFTHARKSEHNDIFYASIGYCNASITIMSLASGVYFSICSLKKDRTELINMACGAAFCFLAATFQIAFWVVSARSGFSKCACLCHRDQICSFFWWFRENRTLYTLAIFGFAFVVIFLTPAILSIKDLLEEDSPQYDPPQYDSPGPECVTYSKAAVASSSQTCSDIGSSVMENNNGNAIDAAIATVLCLGVVEFQSSGIGGGGYLVVYNKSSKSSTAVDFRCQAPSGATENMLNGVAMSAYPGMYVAVPGELRALEYMWKHFGSGNVTWKELFEPAISLAENGFRVSKDLEAAIQILSAGSPKNGHFNYLENDIEQFQVSQN